MLHLHIENQEGKPGPLAQLRPRLCYQATLEDPGYVEGTALPMWVVNIASKMQVDTVTMAALYDKYKVEAGRIKINDGNSGPPAGAMVQDTVPKTYMSITQVLV